MEDDGELNAPEEDDDEVDETEDILPIGKSRSKLLSKTNEYDDNEPSDNESDADTVDIESDNNSDIDDEEDEIEDDGEEENPATTNTMDERGPDQQNSFLDIEDDEDEDDTDEDENYLQKFDESIQQHIIEDFHPELKMHNYEEVEVLSRIVRDPYGNIIDPLHKTLPFITRYEKARVLGERAKQLNAGAKSTIEVDANVIDGYLIAMKEFDDKKIPFIIKRPLPNGGCEYWRVSDLEILS